MKMHGKEKKNRVKGAIPLKKTAYSYIENGRTIYGKSPLSFEKKEKQETFPGSANPKLGTNLNSILIGSEKMYGF